MKIRLIESPLAVPRYRQIRLPIVAAEFSPYAEVEINDENIEPVDFSPVDLVGITAQAYNAPRAIYLSKKFRAMGMRTIVGGPYPTALPEDALAHFDAVVAGEVEGLGARIMDDLESGRLGGIYRNEEPPTLSGLRPPRRDLQKANKYYWVNYPLESSRGCPHRCNFCFGPYAHPTYRTRSLDDIARDLEGWDHGLIELVDWNFAADKQHVLEVCRLLEGMGNFGWIGEATLRSMDDEEVLEALERSNCKQVFVGIESIDEATLASANKSFNKVEDYKRIIGAMQDRGVFVHAGLMFGLDGQTEETFEATAKFCEETSIYLASVNIAAYYPGTAAYKELEKKGRLLTKDYRDFDSVRVVVEPRGMSVEEVYDGTRRFLKRFYSYGSIFMRSFQNANFRYGQLFDFWGLNLIYRSYFKMWGRQLGREGTNWPAKTQEERDSFPHVGGKMPLIYPISDKEGRFFDRWYRAWDRAPRPASKAFTFLLVFIACLSSGTAFAEARLHSAASWPVPWPSPLPALAVFVFATALSTWLVWRLGRTRATLFELFFLLLFSMSPMVLCILALPEPAGAWRFFLALMTLPFFLKAWSVLSSNGLEKKSFLRVASFLLLYPTLDFDGAFIINPKKKQLIRHFPLMLAGFLKILAGLALLPVIFYVLVLTYGIEILSPLGWIGRLLALYLLLSGTLEYLTAYWRMYGYILPPPFLERPFGPAGPAAIWRSWNRPFHLWLVRHVYVPLGGRERPVLATLAVFLTSGLAFAALLAPSSPPFPVGVLLFFLAQGVLTAAEKTLAGGRGADHPSRTAWVFYLLAAGVFFAFAPWLFQATDRIFI